MQNKAEFERKYTKAMEELNNKTNWRSNYAYRLTEKFRVRFGLRPPYYSSFVSVFTQFALIASLGILFSERVITPFVGSASSQTVTILSLLGAILMGLWIALYIRFTAQKNNLSKWSDL